MNSISNFADKLTVRSYDEFKTKFVPTHQPVDKLPLLLIFLIILRLYFLNNYANDLNNRFL